MFRSSRAVTLASRTGDPLPHVPFMRDLYAEKTEIYRGSLVMIAGTPGASKSMFGLNLAHHMNVPVLYFSADSDAATQISRLAAMHTNITSASIRTHLSDEAQHERFKTELRDSKVQWVFDANPDAYDIVAELNAYVELYDAFPEVIIIDNLRNVYAGQESEHAGYKQIQQELIQISRDTGACIITMHHMKLSEKRDQTQPAPATAVDGMVTQLPAQVFSVARDDDEFRIVVVKDRENEAWPNAEEAHWHRLRIDPATSQFFVRDTTPHRGRQVETDVRNGLAPSFDGW